MATCGKCKETGQTVEHVRSCYNAAGAAVFAAGISAPAADRPATERQVSYLRKLVAERMPQDVVTSALVEAVVKLGFRTVSDAIDQLKKEPVLRSAAPAVAPLAAAAALEPGMYRKADGTMYRVYRARNGGHHLLAKELVPNGGSFGFSYAGGAARFVTADERMTLEEAKAFGVVTGQCCVCAALLTDPVSVAAGIGPVCGGRV